MAALAGVAGEGSGNSSGNRIADAHHLASSGLRTDKTPRTSSSVPQALVITEQPTWHDTQKPRARIATFPRRPTTARMDTNRGVPSRGLIRSTHRSGATSGPKFDQNSNRYPPRSEERRVGKECRSRWSTYQ